MIMSIFNQILFAGDLSERSRGRSAPRARSPVGPACICTSWASRSRSWWRSRRDPRGARLPSVLPASTAAHRKEFEGQLRAFYSADGAIATDYLVRDGAAVDEILRAADDVEADLIVVGTHGRGGVDRLICGSVAEAVMRESSRPVLIVRNAEPARQGAPIRLILHPTDFSKRSWPALGVARALARADGARLVLQHVAPAEILSGGTFFAPADLGPEREALARLEEESARAGLEGSVQARFSQGDPVTEVLVAAEELGCDLIVMGSHGRTGLRRLMMGSVAETVIRKAPCLTLVVKDVAGQEADDEGLERAFTKDAGAVA